ncbi:alkaline phosphatase family protein [Bradyrhizobium sp. LHD-71]|uniref:alkaline phosphatase family protein n=1 Tax=Bradyrhizobium sp. LHD-71 TaxID=3072141 RepID=UPI00280F5A46|nr:alkaline phosphatase family protein [Bradyrhizobium sp. LHD-71]MDQ8730467.1 alkaline phosphatase family protein [Bradyrhizobium sp. LHD-71]
MTRRVKNILFIMCDQLRFDYLSCAGHPTLKTPHIDALAARGVRFTRAYVQSPVCGSSRMSFYTGRYVDSHGATWNGVPLKVGEMTIGDYLRPLGVDAVLVGKTHMKADTEGMERLGIDPQSIIGVRVAECGFDPYERDDGLHAVGPDGRYDPQVPRYNRYLKEKGYSGENPWHDHANAAEGEHNSLASGWAMRHARRPARVAEEDSETPYMTSRAMDFMAEAGDRPWCLHLSFIKPHWPYIAPKPYNDMYAASDVIPVVRSENERRDPHPVYREFMDLRVSRNFSRDDVRREVVPVYMGLIRQIDDQLGRLFAFMRERGLMDNTLIIFTSDHGDYLGDHWLGEKDLFHEPSVKVPLIVVDPSPAADRTRGSACDALVEAIDLLPTFLDVLGRDPLEQSHRLEGRSLRPWLHGEAAPAWRDVAFSEYDYSLLPVGAKLGVAPRDARLYMAVDRRWKYVHAIGFRPMLYDLQDDPDEFRDLGADPAYRKECDRLAAALSEWGLRQSQRTTRSERQMLASRGKSMRRGILIGVWDESELPDELWQHYRGD